MAVRSFSVAKRWVAAASCFGLVGACVASTQESSVGDDSDAPAMPTEDVAAGQDSEESVAPPVPKLLDLLVVLDDTRQMLEPQILLAPALRSLVSAVRTGPDAFDSVHLGVVTADLGSYSWQRACPGAGDDGAFVHPYLEIDSDTPLVEDELRERVRLGETGCPYEQPLEAAFKALSDSSVVFDNGVGHADGANAGFLRESSVLAVLFVGSEDDCSAPETQARLFYDGNVLSFTRCIDHADSLYPVERYVEGLRALRPNAPERIVVSAISGTPRDRDGEDAQAVLSDPRLVPDIGDHGGDGIDTIGAVCEAPSITAEPSPRMTELVAAFGGQVWSLCSDDYIPAAEALAQTLLERNRAE